MHQAAVGQAGTGGNAAVQAESLSSARASLATSRRARVVFCAYAVVALFGTGWRNSVPVSVTIGGRDAVVEFAGPNGNFPGLDQLNVRLPDGVTGSVPVIVRAANGATSRSDVTLTIN